MDRKLPVASLLSLTIAALLGGCGGSDSADKTTDPVTLEVRAVDGYLKGALVWLDVTADNQLTIGEPTAVTDGSGKATLDVTAVTNPAQYQVLVKAIVGQTEDVGDGTGTPKPVTKTFTMSAPAGISTVTPLTTLVAQQMAANTGMTQEQAAQEVATQLGLGADKAGDLLKDFIAENNKTGQIYALNIVAALPEVLDDKQADALLTQGGNIGKALNDYLTQNPLDDETQPDDIKVVIGDDGQVEEVIKDSDGDSVADDRDTFPDDPKEWLDNDGDKVGDNSDAFPSDAKEWKDSDGDKIGDNSDAFPSDAKEWKDSDGDKVGDNSDAFPSDAKEWKDSDGDKVGDNSDAFPSDAKEWKDSDGDKVGDNSDTFPSDAKEWKDSDGDKVGDNSDIFPADAKESKDSDGDKVGDNSDAFPADAKEFKDSDGDKVGDNSDAFPADAKEFKDSDGDKVGDNSDAFPADAKESKDSDGDKVGDNSDAFPADAKESKDSDGDKVGDNSDAFPADAKESKDSDGDKVGDNSDAFPADAKESKDSDGDKVGDNSDAFPTDAKEWKDSDGDKVGDNSDAFPTDAKEWKDSDGDKVGDNSDAFPADAKEWKDSDGDKVGDNSDAFPTDAKEWKDSDGDKVGDNSDAFPSDATRVQADLVTNIEVVDVYMEDHTKQSLDVKQIAKETVSYYLDGKTVTVEEGAHYYWDKAKSDYVYLNGAKLIYNEYKSSTTENPDGTFLRTSWWHKDVNKDGQFQFAGQTVEQGQKGDGKESYWVFFDEDAALTETGVNDNPNNRYDDVDLAAAVAAKDYSKVDMAHYVTVTKSDSTTVRHFVQRMAPKQAPSDMVPSNWLDIEQGTPAADYAETDTYQTLADGGTVHTDESDWAADGTINRTESIESHPDGTKITKSSGPVWANPRDTQFDEYADYNWQNSERGSYWFDRVITVYSVDGKAVTRDEGQRYILDQNNNANVKLVTDEQPDGLKFNDYVSISTTVSATETNEFASWTNYHLDGYPFTIATTEVGQNYKVFLKEDNGFWVGHRFAEWGSQNVTDLAAKVEALRKQGVALEGIDDSLLPGLSNYDGYLLTSSFRYQEDGQPRTWFWVTNLPAITGDATSQTWKKVKLQLVNDGLAEAGYPNWIINDAGGALFLLQPKSDSPWDWYTAYDFLTLTSWKQAGHTIDTVQGKFDTGYGSFFLSEADAETALSEHATVVDSDGDGVADTNDAFPNDASEWNDSDGDGVGDNTDAFPYDPSKWQGESGYARIFPTMYLRGTLNNWGVTPMALVADHTWSITVTLASTDEFKFDVDGTWSTNFGDNDGDSASEPYGGNIIPAVSGTYIVQFNDLTSSYSVQPVSAEDAVAAAAFADLVTSKSTIYTLYSEQGNLGITEVTNANQFMPYLFDYSTNLLTVDEAHLGTGELVVNDDDSVSLMVANTQGVLEQDGTIRCSQVLTLDGTQIKTLLAQVTDADKLAAMEAKFATAAFSAGAKAYVNTHSYGDSSSDVEVVLNGTAYQDLLAIIGNPI